MPSSYEIGKIAEILIAMFGGGALFKIFDILSRRKNLAASAEATTSKTAMQQVEHLLQEVKRANELAERFRKEFDACRESFEKMRIEVTDLKIAFRVFYNYMNTHMESCPVKNMAEIPKIPDSVAG